MGGEVRITRVLTVAQFATVNELIISLGLYRCDRRVFRPGWAYYEPWYFCPDSWTEQYSGYQAMKRGETHFLSQFYWDDWADKRPPICIVCPDGQVWEPDRKSRGGPGWKVTGDLPNITCSPSIVTNDYDGVHYHGFLRGGVFTSDMDGKFAPPPEADPEIMAKVCRLLA